VYQSATSRGVAGEISATVAPLLGNGNLHKSLRALLWVENNGQCFLETCILITCRVPSLNILDLMDTGARHDIKLIT
jgi:hypothetical protein